MLKFLQHLIRVENQRIDTFCLSYKTIHQANLYLLDVKIVYMCNGCSSTLFDFLNSGLCLVFYKNKFVIVVWFDIKFYLCKRNERPVFGAEWLAMQFRW